MKRWTNQTKKPWKEAGNSAFPLPSFPAPVPSLAILFCAFTCASARADVVEARGRQPLVSTQVLSLHEGRLVCKTDAGSEISFPIEQVDYLQITGWQMLNLAEKQRRAEDWRRAAVSYEKALADLQLAPATVPQSQSLDRVLLVKCRLIPAWDAQARFERAVELYLEVLGAMPEVVEKLQPTQFPDTGSAVLEMAARHVDAAIERHGDDPIGQSLRRWKATWPVRPTAAAPEDPETNAAPAPSAEQRTRQEMRRIGALVESAKYDEALASIRSLQAQVGGALRGDLYYWQGRALEAMLGRAAASQPADAIARAGLAYMRVVVHFPRHPLAAECLYRAGELCQRGGRREEASRLWSELMSHYPQAKSPEGKLWADKAREEMK